MKVNMGLNIGTTAVIRRIARPKCVRTRKEIYEGLNNCVKKMAKTLIKIPY